MGLALIEEAPCHKSSNCYAGLRVDVSPLVSNHSVYDLVVACLSACQGPVDSLHIGIVPYHLPQDIPLADMKRDVGGYGDTMPSYITKVAAMISGHASS